MTVACDRPSPCAQAAWRPRHPCPAYFGALLTISSHCHCVRLQMCYSLSRRRWRGATHRAASGRVGRAAAPAVCQARPAVAAPPLHMRIPAAYFSLHGGGGGEEEQERERREGQGAKGWGVARPAGRQRRNPANSRTGGQYSMAGTAWQAAPRRTHFFLGRSCRPGRGGGRAGQQGNGAGSRPPKYHYPLH